MSCGTLGACGALTDRSTWQADELLHSLERRRLVERARRPSIDGETEFSFNHALTREVAYAQIPRAERAQKHEAAAGWITDIAGKRGDKAELLAGHYQHALELRRALGEDTAPLRLRALDAFTNAGRHALASHAYTLAANYFETALDLCPVDDSQLFAELLLGQAEARLVLDTADRRLLETAITAQVDAQQWEAAARAEQLLGGWLYQHEPGPEIDAAYARAMHYLERIPPTLGEVAASQALRLHVAGNAGDALLELTDRIMAIADAEGFTVAGARVGVWRGYARIALGDAGGLDDMRLAAATLDAAGDVHSPSAYNNVADAARGLGDMQTADIAYLRCAELAERFGEATGIDNTLIERATQAYHAGWWGDSAELLQRTTLRENLFIAWSIAAVSGYLCLGAGNPAQGLEHAATIIAYGEAAENVEAMLYGHALAARCQITAADAAAAADGCDEFLRHWHAAGGMPARAIELCEIAVALAHLNRHDDIRHAAALLPQAARWRGALEHMANRRYAEAAKLYADIGSEPLAADAHLLAARQASEDGRPGDAAHHAAAVTAFADATGATLYRQQAEPLLSKTA